MTGSGTQSDPYIIYNVNDLQAMADDLNAYYELGQDIDASATTGWNWSEVYGIFLGFYPIGSTINPFSGHLDGKGHKITDLYTSAPGAEIALFGVVSGTVTDVGLVDVDLRVPDPTVAQETAALAAGNTGTITKCYATGNVECSFWTGGLVSTNSGVIEQSFSLVNVRNDTGWGIQGGGFVCYNYGTIRNCYARGDVTSPVEAVGFAVQNRLADGLIENCYSTGLVTAGVATAGFCSWNESEQISNCFWDTETSGTETSDGGTGRTTSQMKTKSTFTDAGWDFVTIWNIDGITNNGYPFHGVGVTFVPIVFII